MKTQLVLYYEKCQHGTGHKHTNTHRFQPFYTSTSRPVIFFLHLFWKVHCLWTGQNCSYPPRHHLTKSFSDPLSSSIYLYHLTMFDPIIIFTFHTTKPSHSILYNHRYLTGSNLNNPMSSAFFFPHIHLVIHRRHCNNNIITGGLLENRILRKS